MYQERVGLRRLRTQEGRPGIEKLGDAEIEELRLTVVPYENVPGLDVSMHDEAGVRVLNAGANFAEQLETSRNGERLGVRVPIDRDAFAVCMADATRVDSPTQSAH